MNIMNYYNIRKQYVCLYILRKLDKPHLKFKPFHKQALRQNPNIKDMSNLNKLTHDKELISMNLLQFTQLQGTLQVFCYYRNMYKQTEHFIFHLQYFLLY